MDIEKLLGVSNFMLRCSKCCEFKSKLEFNKDNNRARGFQSYCKSCEKVRKLKYDKDYYLRTLSYQKERSIIYRESNYDKLREIRLSKKDEHNKQKREYYRKNKAASLAKYNKRRAYKHKAALNYDYYKDEIKLIYENRPDGMHVDHIIPLQGKDVCGLHVPWNLQYLPAEENRRKGNRIL